MARTPSSLLAVALACLVNTATGQRCNLSDLATGQMNSLCCNGGSGHRRNMQDGCVLSTCSTHCAAFYVPFFDACQSQLGSDIDSSMSDFYNTCQSVTGGYGSSVQEGDSCTWQTQEEDCGTDFFCRQIPDPNDPWSGGGDMGCHMKSGLGESCGGMVMPGYESVCMDQFDCVTPMGMMDGGGTCQEKCGHGSTRDDWGNCAPITCTDWFDGCNHCHRVDGQSWLQCDGESWSCYQANQNGPAHCEDTTAPPPPAEGGGDQPDGCVSAVSCEDMATSYCDGGTPSQSCWPVTGNGCGESDDGFATVGFGGVTLPGNQCYGDDDTEIDGWEQARSICYEIGARLCTGDELTAGYGTNSGCGHNAAAVWAAESCDAGHIAITGAFPNALQLCSEDTASNVAVRCCADSSATLTQWGGTAGPVQCDGFAAEEGQCTSSMSCADLAVIAGDNSWPTAMGDVAVCGESDQGLGPGSSSTCYGSQGTAPIGFTQANSICNDAGARLCTVEELEADETRGTGCNHDSMFVWSSTDIGCQDGQHLAVMGSSAFADGTQICVENGASAAVRCCADVEVGVPCGSDAPAPEPAIFCGGFSGALCPVGQRCISPPNCPDCGGTCQ